MPLRLLAAISGHGFGHLAQSAPVLNRLRAAVPKFEITVRSALPYEVLARRIEGPFTHQHQADDFGMVMHDALRVDVTASAEKYRAWHDDWPRRVAAAAGGDRRAATVRTMNRTASLVVRNLLFTIVVPGLGGVLAPWWILTGGGRTSHPLAWPAVPRIVAGAVLYACCVWNFAAVGRGTPGPWDAPRRVVAAGPYRLVRNPIYLAALAIVGGEAWLFMSLRLLIYAAAMAACFHLFVVGYEERALRRRFDGCYEEYRRDVPRWIPRRPRPHR